MKQPSRSGLLVISAVKGASRRIPARRLHDQLLDPVYYVCNTALRCLELAASAAPAVIKGPERAMRFAAAIAQLLHRKRNYQSYELIKSQ